MSRQNKETRKKFKGLKTLPRKTGDSWRVTSFQRTDPPRFTSYTSSDGFTAFKMDGSHVLVSIQLISRWPPFQHEQYIPALRTIEHWDEKKWVIFSPNDHGRMECRVVCGWRLPKINGAVKHSAHSDMSTRRPRPSHRFSWEKFPEINSIPAYWRPENMTGFTSK